MSEYHGHTFLQPAYVVSGPGNVIDHAAMLVMQHQTAACIAELNGPGARPLEAETPTRLNVAIECCLTRLSAQDICQQAELSALERSLGILPGETDLGLRLHAVGNAALRYPCDPRLFECIRVIAMKSGYQDSLPSPPTKSECASYLYLDAIDPAVMLAEKLLGEVAVIWRMTETSPLCALASLGCTPTLKIDQQHRLHIAAPKPEPKPE